MSLDAFRGDCFWKLLVRTVWFLGFGSLLAVMTRVCCDWVAFATITFSDLFDLQGGLPIH